jgi:hypothetical protein
VYDPSSPVTADPGAQSVQAPAMGSKEIVTPATPSKFSSVADPETSAEPGAAVARAEVAGADVAAVVTGACASGVAIASGAGLVGDAAACVLSAPAARTAWGCAELQDAPASSAAAVAMTVKMVRVRVMPSPFRPANHRRQC